MFFVTLSIYHYKETRGPTVSDHSPSQPKNVCQQPIFKAYLLITPAITPKHHYALLDSKVLFTSTAPYLLCETQHSNGNKHLNSTAFIGAFPPTTGNRLVFENICDEIRYLTSNALAFIGVFSSRFNIWFHLFVSRKCPIVSQRDFI